MCFYHDYDKNYLGNSEPEINNYTSISTIYESALPKLVSFFFK